MRKVGKSMARETSKVDGERGTYKKNYIFVSSR